jgi:D-alanyl-D-alanine endopeptidase (penicillin-binding protein 7)
MDESEEDKNISQGRTLREIGIALTGASFLLAIFLAIPLGPKEAVSAPVIVVATSTTPDAFADVPLEAQAAVVYDLATNEILYAKNADAQLPLASLTKLLTVYAALAQLSPDTPIDIPEDVTHLEAPRAFSRGQTFSLADLARLTLTASLNDGAAAISQATAARQNRSESAALAVAAASLNLTQTYAINGTGLDVSPTVSGGYGSARDLARLAGALFEESPAIAAATTQSSAQAFSTSGAAFTVKNTDPIIASIPRLLLSKTGYTDLAGGNLALVFDSGIQHSIAVVVLGSTQKARFTDGAALVARALAHFAGIASL